MKLGILASAGLGALTLSGCAVVSDIGATGLAEKIESNAVTLNDAHTRADTSIIAMNVLRARDRWPTNYTTLSGIKSNPTLQLNGSATFGPLGLGNPRVPFGASNATIQRNETANAEYSVNPFSNNDRSQSLLRPMKPELFEGYWRAGWPRETLMWLFVESIQFTDGGERWKIKGSEFAPDASPDVKALTQRYIELIRRAKANEIEFTQLPAPSLDQRHCSTYDPVYLRETLGGGGLAGGAAPGGEARGGGGGGGAMGDTVKTIESLTGKQLVLATDTRAPTGEPIIAPDRFNRRLMLCDNIEQAWGFVDRAGKVVAQIHTRSFDDMIYFLGETLRQSDEGHPVVIGDVVLFQTYKERGARQFAVRVEHAGQVYFIAPQSPVNQKDGFRDVTGNVLSLLNQLYLLAQSDDFLKAPQDLLHE